MESSIQVPLNADNSSQPNVDYVFEHVATLFGTHFNKNLTG